MTLTNGHAAAAAPSYALEGLTRRFPGVLAVDQVDLRVAQGEIHGIIGRNGAGKSVLVSMVAGIIPPSAGRIRVGEGVIDSERWGPARAHALGVSLIPQEPKFARRLSIVDNLFMGREITGALDFVRPAAMLQQVEAVMERLAIDARPSDPIGDLPIEAQQLLAFGKALFIENARVILLDEITASLTQARKEMLLGLLREIAVSGEDISFTLISHHISEVLEFADRVTVMRDGKAVASIPTADTTERELAHWIVGDTPQVTITPPDRARRANGEGPPLLAVEALSGGGAFEGLSFTLDRGEVVGFAGLEGSGKDAAIETLFGLHRPSAGTLRFDGEPVTIASPEAALERGIAFLPKHREAQGVIHGRSVEENTLISSYEAFADRFGWIRGGRARVVAEARTRALKVKTPSLATLIDHLSGGNKQRVLINRLAIRNPQLLLLNEPTRGVDIAAKPDLLKIIREQLAQDSGVIMISESEEELIEICDRILVFFRGRVAKVVERGREDFNVAEVYRLIQGVRAA